MYSISSSGARSYSSSAVASASSSALITARLGLGRVAEQTGPDVIARRRHPRSAVDGHMSRFGRVLCLVSGLRSC